VKGHGEKFSRRMEAAIVALLEQPSIPEAAKAAGISYTSLWRWLQDPEFQAEYRNARRQALGQATAQLQQASGAAVKALKQIIEDRESPSSARVMAARTILEMGLKAIELEEIEARLAAVEQAVNSKAEGATPIRNAR
jgi:molybdenum-dependent DNA-binding transcriptional regulator ModE